MGNSSQWKFCDFDTVCWADTKMCVKIIGIFKEKDLRFICWKHMLISAMQWHSPLWKTTDEDIWKSKNMVTVSFFILSFFSIYFFSWHGRLGFSVQEDVFAIWHYRVVYVHLLELKSNTCKHETDCVTSQLVWSLSIKFWSHMWCTTCDVETRSLWTFNPNPCVLLLNSGIFSDWIVQ